MKIAEKAIYICQSCAISCEVLTVDTKLKVNFFRVAPQLAFLSELDWDLFRA